MKSHRPMFLVVVCLALLAPMGEARTTPAEPTDPGNKEVKAAPPKSSPQTRSTEQRTRDPWEGKERVRGWSAGAVVLPSYGYYAPYCYPPVIAYPYDAYYRYQPWGYDGPPVISVGDRYDSALVWDRSLQGFKWDPILPRRPESGVLRPVVNPNFAKRKSEEYEPAELQPGETGESRGSQSVAQPEGAQEAAAPARTPNRANWEKRGLVSSVDHAEKQVAIITPDGKYAVDCRDASVISNGRTVALSRISEGDAVMVRGELSGLNRVRADRIEITGARGRQEGQEALLPVTARGKITNIDYPSFTLRVQTESAALRVLASEDTRISSPDNERKAFMDLRLGQTVKLVAIGSLTSGYAASEVLILEDSGNAR